MGERYRAALIGCGNISHRHARAFLEQGNVDIVAACDINKDHLDQVCDEFEIPNRYVDHVTMLAKEKDIDLISVCTYPRVHAEHTINSARAGVRGVLCEKPMCLGVDEAQAMIDACAQSGTKLAVAFRHRQNPNFIKAKELVASGAIGEPMLAWCYLQRSLINNGCHMVDMIRYLLGDPKTEWVMGQAGPLRDTLYQESPVELASIAFVKFEGGTRGLVESGELVEPNGFKFRVWGSEGTIEATTRSVLLMDSSGAQNHDQEPNSGFAEQTGELIRWLEGGPAHRSPGENGLANTEILMAAHESARTGQLIHMPFEDAGYPMLKRVGQAGGSA
jgi:predicted dehydrogenase